MVGDMSPGNLHPQFIVDAQGRRAAAVLPMAEFEQLLELLEDLEDAADAHAALAGGEFIPWEQVKAELLADDETA
jgi:hypothetical protein